MKLVIVGGFDYAVKWEMNADVLVRYIDSVIDFEGCFENRARLSSSPGPAQPHQ